MWEHEVEAKSSLCKYIREQCPLPYINVMTFRQELPGFTPSFTPPALSEGIHIRAPINVITSVTHWEDLQTSSSLHYVKITGFHVEGGKEQHKMRHEQLIFLFNIHICRARMKQHGTHSSPTRVQGANAAKIVHILTDSFSAFVLWVTHLERVRDGRSQESKGGGGGWDQQPLALVVFTSSLETVVQCVGSQQEKISVWSDVRRERGCSKMKRKDKEGTAKCGSRRGRNLVVSVCASKQLEKADVPASPICLSHPRLSRAPQDQSFLFCFSHHSVTVFLSLSPFGGFVGFIFAWILLAADPLLGSLNDPPKLSCGSWTKTEPCPSM